jgi:hypothetical protein
MRPTSISSTTIYQISIAQWANHPAIEGPSLRRLTWLCWFHGAAEQELGIGQWHYCLVFCDAPREGLRRSTGLSKREPVRSATVRT